MSSFKFNRDPRRKQFMRLITRIHDLLDEAYWEEHSTKKLSKVQIAQKLNVNKGLVSRWFAGTSNMTLETFSNLAFELGRDVEIELKARDKQIRGANYHIASGDVTWLTSIVSSTDAPEIMRATTTSHSSGVFIKEERVPA